MFSYKGVNKDFKYQVGTVEAEDEIEALRLIKEEKDILIVVSLQKEISNVVAKGFISNLRKTAVKFENNLLHYKLNFEKKSREKSLKKNMKSLKKSKNKSAPAPGGLAEKSPILKLIKSISSGLSKSPGLSKKPKVNLQEKVENDIEFIFKGNSNMMTSEEFEEMMSYEKEKLAEIDNIPLDNKEGKTINWDLLDKTVDDPDIKKNSKLKVKNKEILMFTRRLQIMISSGVSLMNSLSILRETSSKNMAIVMDGVLQEINMGNSLSSALAKYPKVFNASYVSLVSIGETSGELDNCLLDIIKMREQEQKVMKKVKTASIYPGIIGIVLIVMMVGASLWFLPKFEEMFLDQGLNIPQFTAIVFGIAGKVPIIVGVIAALLGITFYLKKKSKKVNRVITGIVDKALLKLPVVKGITNALYMYYFSSTVSLMLKNGIRLSDTLELASRSINNIYIRSEIENIGQLMIHGLSFSEAMRRQEHFDDILINITYTGEEAGQMTFSLTKVSEYYETELNNQVDAMMEIVPSASIIAIGLIAAPIIVAAYLPILDISSGANMQF